MAVFLGALLDPKWGYRFVIVPDQAETHVYAELPDGTPIGDVTVTKGRDKAGDYLLARNVWVHPSHRRRGLANEMYRRLEDRLGARFRPSGTQTGEGRKFWAQSNRPFGGVRPLQGALPAQGPIPDAEVRLAMRTLAVRDIPFDLLKEGMEVEREHGDLTKRDAVQTARIALAHLRERRDYYKLLKRYVER